jgi:hypothetical protein
MARRSMPVSTPSPRGNVRSLARLRLRGPPDPHTCRRGFPDKGTVLLRARGHFYFESSRHKACPVADLRKQSQECGDTRRLPPCTGLDEALRQGRRFATVAHTLGEVYNKVRAVEYASLG